MYILFIFLSMFSIFNSIQILITYYLWFLNLFRGWGSCKKKKQQQMIDMYIREINTELNIPEVYSLG